MRRYSVDFYPHGGVAIRPFVPSTPEEMRLDENGELTYGYTYQEAIKRVMEWYADQLIFFANLDEETFNFDPTNPAPVT